MDQNVNVTYTANTGQYTQSLAEAIAVTERYGQVVGNAAGGVAKLGTIATRAMLSFGTAGKGVNPATQTAAAYQQQLSLIEARAKSSQQNVSKLTQDVRQLARDFPIGLGGAIQQFETLQRQGKTGKGLADITVQMTKLGAATGELGPRITESMSQFSRTFNNFDAKGVRKIGDSVTHLSSQFGASASSMLDFSNAIAPLSKQLGMTSTEVLGFSTAFSRAGEDGYRAANVFNKMLGDMERSVRTGSKETRAYAEALGMTNDQFIALADSDAGEAMVRFIESISTKGRDGIRILEDLGLDGVRSMRSIMAVASTGDVRDMLQQSASAYGSDRMAVQSAEAFNGLNDSITKVNESMKQMVEASGRPMVGVMGGIADATSKVSSTFAGIAHSDPFQQISELMVMLGLGAGVGKKVLGLGFTAGGTKSLFGMARGGARGLKNKAMGNIESLAMLGPMLMGQQIDGTTGKPVLDADGKPKVTGTNYLRYAKMAGIAGLGMGMMSGNTSMMMMGGAAMALPWLLRSSSAMSDKIVNAGVKGGNFMWGAQFAKDGATKWSEIGNQSGERTGRLYRMAERLSSWRVRGVTAMDYALEDKEFYRDPRDTSPWTKEQREAKARAEKRAFDANRESGRLTKGGAIGRGLGMAVGTSALGLGGIFPRIGMSMATNPVGWAAGGALAIGAAGYLGYKRNESMKALRESGDSTMEKFSQQVGVAASGLERLNERMAQAAESADTFSEAMQVSANDRAIALDPNYESKLDIRTKGRTTDDLATRLYSQFGAQSPQMLQRVKTDLIALEGSDQAEAIMDRMDRMRNEGTRYTEAYADSFKTEFSGWDRFFNNTIGMYRGQTSMVEDAMAVAQQMQTDRGQIRDVYGESFLAQHDLANAPALMRDVMAISDRNAQLEELRGGGYTEDEAKMVLDTFFGQAGLTVTGYKGDVYGMRDKMEEAGWDSDRLDAIFPGNFMRPENMTDEEMAQFIENTPYGQRQIELMRKNEPAAFEFLSGMTPWDNGQGRTFPALRTGLHNAPELVEGLRLAREQNNGNGVLPTELLNMDERGEIDLDPAVRDAVAGYVRIDDPVEQARLRMSAQTASEQAMGNMGLGMSGLHMSNVASEFIEQQAQGELDPMLTNQLMAEYEGYQAALARQVASGNATKVDLMAEATNRVSGIEGFETGEFVLSDNTEIAAMQERDIANYKAMQDQQQMAVHQQAMAARNASIQQEYAREDYARSAGYAREDFGISSARAWRNLGIQERYGREDLARNQAYASEDFQRNRGRQVEDFYRNRNRQVFDFNLQMARQEEDFQRSIMRSEEDFYRERGYAIEDFNRQQLYATEDFNRQMERQADQLARTMLDPFSRITAQSTWSTGGLAGNLAEQNEALQRQMDILDELRAKGMSQDAIDLLQLADPNKAMQVWSMGGASEDDIAALNEQAAARMRLGEQFSGEQVTTRYSTEDFEIGMKRQEEALAISLARSQEQFDISMQRTHDDFSRQMSRSRDDFARAIARADEDFNLSLARGDEDFAIQMARMTEQFEISIARQREQLAISLADQEEDLNRSLARQWTAVEIQGQRAREAVARMYEELNMTFDEKQAALEGYLSGGTETFTGEIESITGVTTTMVKDVSEGTTADVADTATASSENVTSATESMARDTERTVATSAQSMGEAANTAKSAIETAGTEMSEMITRIGNVTNDAVTEMRKAQAESVNTMSENAAAAFQKVTNSMTNNMNKFKEQNQKFGKEVDEALGSYAWLFKSETRDAATKDMKIILEFSSTAIDQLKEVFQYSAGGGSGGAGGGGVAPGTPMLTKYAGIFDRAVGTGALRYGSRVKTNLRRRCLENVQDVWGWIGGRNNSRHASAHRAAMAKAGLMNPGYNAPTGALYWWRSPVGAGYGHVAVSDGRGNAMNNWGGGIIEKTRAAGMGPRAYMGWTYPTALANGGIVNRATKVQLGEGSHHEAVIPLNDRGAKVLGDAMSRYLTNTSVRESRTAGYTISHTTHNNTTVHDNSVKTGPVTVVTNNPDAVGEALRKQNRRNRLASAV